MANARKNRYGLRNRTTNPRPDCSCRSRESSKAVIKKLHDMGIKKTIMLTGDNQSPANAIVKQLQMDDIKADLLPQHKLEYIKQLRKEFGRVAMIGNGVNDAPALAASYKCISFFDEAKNKVQ
jgi:P-type E1-E2 ATPase